LEATMTMTTSSARRRAKRERVELQLLHGDGRRELGAFARYCVGRIERDHGELDYWLVRVAPIIGGFTSTVTVRGRMYATEVTANGFDGALAIWEAMCRIEQRLHELRAFARSG
jgi:hypothetical protein